MVLMAFVSISAVCASDVNQTEDTIATNSEDTLTVSEADAVSDGSQVIPTSAKTSSGSVFIQNYTYDIQILDGDGKGIAQKPVYINYRDAWHVKTTDSSGHVHFMLHARGTYALNYIFNETGYAPINKTSMLTIVDSEVSEIIGSNYVAYVGFKNTFEVTLKAGNFNLPNQEVVFAINGKKYYRTTDANGKASLNIKLDPGRYKINYLYRGQNGVGSAKGSDIITVQQGMPTKLIRKCTLEFRDKMPDYVKFRYLDIRGNVLAGKSISLKIDKKTYTKKTDKDGMVSFKVKLNKGNHKMTIYSYNTKVYKKCSLSYNLKVKQAPVTNKGFWLFGADMMDVNLRSMAKYGVNQIFLNSYAFTLHGKAAVADFAKKAGDLGINVHIWMKAFYDGNWISSVTSSGAYKYSLFDSLIKEAKYYAAVPGIDGVHFDYIRFPGTAYQHKNGAAAINYFTKQACEALHKQNPKCIVSAAVMAEPGAMKYYYGQDIPTMSKYLDVILPMIYKGNYHQGTSWIKSTSEAFLRMSSGAQVWAGLQGYFSDDNVKRLPASQMKKDAEYAAMTGVQGIIIFRYTLFSMIDFNEL